MKSWRATERQVCRLLGRRHIGGPGEPDCSNGADVVEVKDQERRVTRTQVEAILQKPWAEGLALIIVSTSGFTQGGVELADDYEDVWLYELT